ncbi:hypothetical protein [Algicola sagamiensis]|uniref:hypothetical protein n=1 Tax=Algicola sagamiensis TaxID=163869 RepID=UPI000378A2C8|nr:hypothetical protein [Algicola sagamiensis]
MNKPLELPMDKLVSQHKETLDTKPYEHECKQADNPIVLQNMLYQQQYMLSNIFVTI